jgi:hypothetical protein
VVRAPKVRPFLALCYFSQPPAGLWAVSGASRPSESDVSRRQSALTLVIFGSGRQLRYDRRGPRRRPRVAQPGPSLSHLRLSPSQFCRLTDPDFLSRPTRRRRMSSRRQNRPPPTFPPLLPALLRPHTHTHHFASRPLCHSTSRVRRSSGERGLNHTYGLPHHLASTSRLLALAREDDGFADPRERPLTDPLTSLSVLPLCPHPFCATARLDLDLVRTSEGILYPFSYPLPLSQRVSRGHCLPLSEPPWRRLA